MFFWDQFSDQFWNRFGAVLDQFLGRILKLWGLARRDGAVKPNLKLAGPGPGWIWLKIVVGLGASQGWSGLMWGSLLGPPQARICPHGLLVGLPCVLCPSNQSPLAEGGQCSHRNCLSGVSDGPAAKR